MKINESEHGGELDWAALVQLQDCVLSCRAQTAVTHAMLKPQLQNGGIQNSYVTHL